MPPVSLPLPPFIFSEGEGAQGGIASSGGRRGEELGGQLVRHYFKHYLATSLTPQNSVGKGVGGEGGSPLLDIFLPPSQTSAQPASRLPPSSIPYPPLAPTLLPTANPPSAPFYPLLFRGLAPEEKRRGSRGLGLRGLGTRSAGVGMGLGAGVRAGEEDGGVQAGLGESGSKPGERVSKTSLGLAATGAKVGVELGANLGLEVLRRDDKAISRRQKKSNKRFKLSWGPSKKGGEVTTLSCSFKGTLKKSLNSFCIAVIHL